MGVSTPEMIYNIRYLPRVYPFQILVRPKPGGYRSVGEGEEERVVGRDRIRRDRFTTGIIYTLIE